MTIALHAQRESGASRRGRSVWLARCMRFLPIVPTLLFLLVFFIMPVSEILQGGLVDANGQVGLAQFERIARTPVSAKVLWITFALSFMTAALSILLGYPVAYLLSRLSERARERWLLWIMLPFAADWRWFTGDDCPWYPAATLVRQPAPGHWLDVTAKVAAALHDA